MNTIFIKPKKDLVVRDPNTAVPLPADGRLVDKSTYWLRRIADGDVTVEDANAEPETPPVGNESRENDSGRAAGKSTNRATK